MSQPPPESKPRKNGYRWLWVVLAMFCFVPVMMIVGLIGLYMLRSKASPPYYAHPARDQAMIRQLQEATRTVPLQTPASSPIQGPKKRPHVVRIQLDFEDFDTRFANAITVDRDQQGSRLMVPSLVFAPISGKINGRVVTRTAGSPQVIEVRDEPWPGGGMPLPPGSGMGGAPGMAGATMGGSPVVAGVSIPGIGLTELTLNNWDLTPIRVIGDFPDASIGDKLSVVSLPEEPGVAREVTVLGIDESTQLSDGSKLDHLLKLTESTGAIGALLVNSTGDPIGQVVFTTSGKLRYSYAVPMNRIFQAIYEHKHQGSSAFPGQLQPQKLVVQSPILNGKMEDTTARVRNAAPDLPVDAQNELAAESRARDAVSLDPFAPAPEPSRVEPRLPTLPPQTLPTGNPRVPTNSESAAEITPADASQPDRSVDQETKVHQVIGPAQEVAETLRSLYGDVAKIAANQTSRSVITVASPTVQEQIAATIEDLRKRALMLEDEQVKRDAREMERMKALNDSQRAQMQAARKAVATKATVAEEDRENPPATTTSPVVEVRQQVQLYSEQDHEAKQLALQLRTAASSDQPALREKLERLTEQQFRARQDLRKKEIDDLSIRIDQLRVTQLRRQQNQAEIIRRRIEELLDPNNDLQWEEPQSGATAPVDSKMTPATADNTQRSTVERTFDSVTYSQWLRLLETERKPAKLAAAIEACSRLAQDSDAGRIANLIIVTANLRPLAENNDRREIWQAADAALLRMPREIVLDELLATLSNSEAAKSRRDYQCHLLQSHYLRFQKVLVDREKTLVAELIKAIRENGEDRDTLLTTASLIWMYSDRGLGEFEGLEALVLQSVTGKPKEIARGDDWYLIANALVAKNPETPDLAIKLLNYARETNQFDRVLPLIGRLEKHANPAVTPLITYFLEVWKELNEIDKNDPNDDPQFRNQKIDLEQRAAKIVAVLGDIGVGERAALLLKELNLMASYSPSYCDAIFDEAKIAIRKFAAVSKADMSPILDDDSLMLGSWQVKSVNSKPQPDFRARIGNSEFYWAHVVGDRIEYVAEGIEDQSTGTSLKLDPAKSPKEARFQLSRNSQRHGVYELTESTFKIYVAPADQPKPAEMLKEGSPIPEGYLLIELHRSLSTDTLR